jgi:hypothetical protein
MEEAGGPQEFIEEKFGDMPEEQRQMLEPQVEEHWENREEIMGQPAEPETPPEPENPETPGEEGSKEATA